MRRERVLLLAVLVAALGLRLGYVLSQRGDVLFEHPILDEQRYVDAARLLAAGGGEDRPYWQPPGIVYVLAICFKLAPSLLWPRLLQSLISTAACWLLFAVARRLFSPRVALFACAVLALHGVVIFETSELLPAIWILFFDLLALWLLVGERTPSRAFFTGLTLGVSGLFSPVILPFCAVAAMVLRRPLLVALLIAGVILPIAPVTARNHAHGGEWVPISTNGGLNLYLGNNDRYQETFALRPGRHWEELTHEPGDVPPGAASRYFTGKALAWVRAHPTRALALYARKLYLYFNGAEIARDSDVYAAGSRLLSILIWPRFPDGLILPLALVGMALSWRERRARLLVAFVALQAVITAAFFVSARHRLPALPVCALFAVAACARLRKPAVVATVLALVIVLNLPTRETALAFPGERDFYRGVAWLYELRDPEPASRYLRLATDENPSDARAWFELGNALDRLGEADAAVDAWRRGARLDPWDGRARRRAAMLLERRGDLDGAIGELRASVDSHEREPAFYAPDWLNLAFLYAQRGRIDEAKSALATARDSDPRYFAAHAPRMLSNLDPALRAKLQ